ncbi:hypothetical protein BX667DRAFT_496826 [Coemansia mojavensis]|nr:hypothetical protein BX667DRAFT_496826 [Coemansia mojavensis]
MGKRTAEHQLTQLNQHDEDDSSDYQGSSFQRANESELSRRVIKKPKSRLRSANSNTSDSAPKPAFTGFGGLGASSGNASAEGSSGEQPAAASSFKGFSFGKSASSASEAKQPSFGSTSFGSGSTAFGSGSTGTFKFGSGQAAAKPTVGTQPDTANKPAASGGFSFGTQTKSGFTFGKTSADASESAKPASSQDTKPSGTSSFSFPAFKPPTQAPTLSTNKEPSNALPTSFKSGFVPPGGAKPEETKEASDDEFYRHIRGLNVSIQNKINDAIAVNAFVDLTPLLEQYVKHWKQVTQDYPTSKDTQGEAAESSTKEPSMVAQQPAQPPAQTTKPAQEPAQISKPADPPKFSFGTSSAKPAPNFSFGTSPSKPAGGTTGGFSFSFGKPAPEAAKNDSGEAKKPFSFGFGDLAEKKTSPAASTQKPAFSFGFGKPAEAASKPEDAKADASMNDNDAQSNGGEEEEEKSEPKEPTTAGEEGETTVHSARCKVYMWDGKEKSYKDMGVGNLRVNTWDSDGGAKRARVLCRQETTEKITLNASMFANMMVECTGKDKNVGLLAVVDDKPTRYMLRVKNTQEATELSDALKKVIASL